MRDSALTSVPDRARAQVDNELALLDKQVAEAYQRLQRSAQAARQDGDFADNAITGPLRDERVATNDRIDRYRYWPVLRVQDGTEEFDAGQPGGGAEGNSGRILTATQVSDRHTGQPELRRQPHGKVVAMPRFLRSPLRGRVLAHRRS